MDILIEQVDETQDTMTMILITLVQVLVIIQGMEVGIIRAMGKQGMGSQAMDKIKAIIILVMQVVTPATIKVITILIQANITITPADIRRKVITINSRWARRIRI